MPPSDKLVVNRSEGVTRIQENYSSSNQVWPYFCRYWCSSAYKLKRKRGQECRFSSEDPAQNHGGSRPFTETQQLLEVTFGPDKATPLNTYAVMKSGIKSVCSDGSSGPIKSCKAQKHVDDYVEGVRRVAHSEDDEEHEASGEENQEQQNEQVLNAQVLYEISGGKPHGHFAIVNGAIRASDIMAVAKETNVQPSNSISVQSMAAEVVRLRRENARLTKESQVNAIRHEKNEITTDLLLGLVKDLGKEVPASTLERLCAIDGHLTGSSHAGSDSADHMCDGAFEGMNCGTNSDSSENHGTNQ